MQIADFDFNLPSDLIAQTPIEPRDASRMLVLDRKTASWRDEQFHQLSAHLSPGDTIVVNNTQVFPARLVGERAPSGGKVEVFLVREIEHDEQSPVWETLVRPARRLRVGARITFGDGQLTAEVIEAEDDSGKRIVRFTATGAASFDSLVDSLGRTPLPPYIHRLAEDEPAERARYQTIYAKARGAIAAPTAGLHFTPAVFAALRERGVEVVQITLHVGYGTFAPVRADDLKEHAVAAETFEITSQAAHTINDRRAAGGRTVAVGTTTVRALESAVDDNEKIIATNGTCATELTITPGYRFRAIDALVTNFHLPQSSLLVLTSAFAGRDLLLAAYAHAVSGRYRFYSYGDCMLIV
jgi:S-adenosylmethionine:tRNA ribosyltransferase-isomerase